MTEVTYEADPHARPRIHKKGKRDWHVLVPVGRDNVLGQLRLNTHSRHGSRKAAENELERITSNHA